MKKIHLMWFRQDLRLIDNQALTAAVEDKDAQTVAIYIHTEAQWDKHETSMGARAFVARQLQSLDAELRELNIPFYVLESTDFKASLKLLNSFVQMHHVHALFFNKQYEVNELARDKEVHQWINEIDCLAYIADFDDSVLVPPMKVLTQQGEMYKVFTPFRNAFLKVLTEQHLRVSKAPDKKAENVFVLDGQFESLVISCKDLVQYYEKNTCQSILENLPKVSETEAINSLRVFCTEHAAKYDEVRNFPYQDKTSRLSAYLVHGLLSPRQCVRRLMMVHPNVFNEPKSGAFCWLNELIWREFYKHLIVAFPFLCKHQPMIEWTKNIEWRNDMSLFDAWKEGKTGYPIVDAAMRQLNQTGWMHNRLRMVVASFLVKDLLIDWRLGESYFMSKLVDGDLAANNGGWQWAASTGCDAAPYFRIFNPTSQSEKFDEEGHFIRKYVPELAKLSSSTIHEPFAKNAPFGLNYPKPIVEHKRMREQTLAAYEKAKSFGTALE
ncbi:deoxyribodipyrimidine photo-lyase [Thorsellia kenyensis]|uniref:Deoxyribodipyrimidine photo-lyase n=1 Tax=Thorsellia kenyensis TaxID=1549888 RepID=A0ABV6C768_9GAMM